MIIWLLRNRFLYQVHSYVTLLPPADMSTSSTVDSMTRSDVSVVSSVDAGSLSAPVIAASSDAANPQSVLSSDADAAVNNGVMSERRRVSLDAKDHMSSSKFSWLVCFYARQHICYSSYMPWQFRLSVCLSVCLSHGWISQNI